jgi:hypothetical protein
MKVTRMMGVPGGEDLPDQLLGKVEGLLAVVRQVRSHAAAWGQGFVGRRNS